MIMHWQQVLVHITLTLSILLSPLLYLVAILVQIFKFIFCRNCFKSIAGEIAVVTGGGNGLGKQLCIQLAAKGCHVAVADIDMEGAEKTAHFLNTQYNVKSKAYKVDVTNYEQVMSLRDQVTTDMGVTTILVNNAGIVSLSNFLDPDYREVQRMINVNLSAHFWTLKAFLPKMKELQKGHIVAICSIITQFPLMYNGPYTATKFAVRGLMRVLRQELIANKFKNIHATTIFPSFMNTNHRIEHIMNITQYDHMLRVHDGDAVAKRAVVGISRNEFEVTVPSAVALLSRFYEMIPAKWQSWLTVLVLNTVGFKSSTLSQFNINTIKTGFNEEI